MNPKTEIKSKATLTLTPDGDLARLSVQTDGSILEPARDQIFLLSAKDHKENKRIFRRLDAPLYYLSGAKKKLDLAGDWNADFAAVANAARADTRTTLDIDRLHTLWQAVRNVAWSDAPIVEVGVLRGGSSRLISAACRKFGKAGLIYSCDTFSGHAEVDEEVDGRHTVGMFGDRTSAEDVRDYLSDCPQVSVIEGDITQTWAQIEAPELAMVHVDVDVYPATKFVLAAAVSKLVTGGVIIVDDYGFTTCAGAKKAVDEFLQENPAFFGMHQITGQVVIVKTGR